jgi:hypothetical protein
VPGDLLIPCPVLELQFRYPATNPDHSLAQPAHPTQYAIEVVLRRPLQRNHASSHLAGHVFEAVLKPFDLPLRGGIRGAKVAPRPPTAITLIFHQLLEHRLHSTHPDKICFESAFNAFLVWDREGSVGCGLLPADCTLRQPTFWCKHRERVFPVAST